MRYRTAVIFGAAVLVAYAGSKPQAPPTAAEPASPAAFAVVADDSFAAVGVSQIIGITAVSPDAASVVVGAKPIVRPPRTAPSGVTSAPGSTAGVLVSAYEAAVELAPAGCHLGSPLLAAIGQIESGSVGGRSIDSSHRVDPPIYGPLLDGGQFAAISDTDGGRLDGDGTWDRAVGPMQFIPGTWSWAGVDGDKDGVADPQNVFDAAASAAGYLCRGGRDLSRPGDLEAAILSYNHSADYLAAVLDWKAFFETNGVEAIGSVSFRVASGGRASELAKAEATESPTAAPTTTAPTTAAAPRTPAQPAPAQRTPAPVTTTAPPAPAPTTSTPTSTPTPSSPAPTTPPPSPTTTTPKPTTATTTPAPTTTTTATPAPSPAQTSASSPTADPAPTECPSSTAEPTAGATATSDPTATASSEPAGCPSPAEPTDSPTTLPSPSPTATSPTATSPTATASTEQ